MGAGELREVVVVGASLAGLRAAETLRSHGFGGTVTVVGAERHPPYDRPPLSKRVLAGDWEPERIALRKPDDMGALDVAWRLGSPATGLDLGTRTVRLADGGELGFDGLVIATGASPRRIPGQTEHEHVTELRTLDDALDLRDRIAGGDRRIVVVGAGFVGLEVAATARQLGNEVLVLEGSSAPLARALGDEMGTAVAAVHADHGVEIRCGVAVDGFAPSAVVVDGGTVERADVVVVGVGVVPATAWLEGSGVHLDDGVVCGPDLSTGHPLVYAAGDAVRWAHPRHEGAIRVEHWTNAAEQGAVAAANLLAEADGRATEAYAPVPFFWSEQYDRRIQFLGRTAPGDDVQVVAGSVEERRFAAHFGRGGRLTGVLGVNMPRHVMPMRGPLEAGIGWDEALALSAGR